MARILPIYTYNHSILREKAIDIVEINDDVKSFASSLIATMINANGAGLAANQAGSRYNMFAINLNVDEYTQGSQVVINPKIIETNELAGEDWYEEGCLSFPTLRFNVGRNLHVKIEYLNIAGEQKIFEVKEGMSSMAARIFLHEMDHLNGVLLIDHFDKHGFVGEEDSAKLNSILKKIENGYLNTKYATINK